MPHHDCDIENRFDFSSYDLIYYFTNTPAMISNDDAYAMNVNTNAPVDITMATHAHASYPDPAAESPAFGPPTQDEKGQLFFLDNVCK